MDQQDAIFCIFIYSTIFMSTLHVSSDLVVHHQEYNVVYCITQLCTIVQMCPAALVFKTTRSFETCRVDMKICRINKYIKNCILLVRLHNSLWCTVHTTLNYYGPYTIRAHSNAILFFSIASTWQTLENVKSMIYTNTNYVSLLRMYYVW